MRYEEFKPVSAIPFLIAYTNGVIQNCQQWADTPMAAQLTVDKRGDVDDWNRYPLVIVDSTVATGVKNQAQYGMGLEMRGRWLFQHHSSDGCMEAAEQFCLGLIRSWRSGMRTPEGWASYIDIETEPMLSGQMVSTADITEFTMLARVVARRRK